MLENQSKPEINRRNTFDKDMQNAINTSLKQMSQSNLPNTDDLDTDIMIREEGSFCGLKNINNTCYFNSLIFILFNNERFVDKIMSVKVIEIEKEIEFNSLRHKKSVELIKEIQKLFALMIKGEMSYINPYAVINLVYDENNKRVDIGQQRDVIEYLMIFIEQIDIGLNLISQIKNVKKDQQKLELNEKNLKSELTNLFTGKIIAGIRNDKGNEEEFIEEDYGPLIINARAINMIEALKEKFEYEIETKIEDGVAKKIIKNEWIKEPSDVMVIQLNMVNYDQKTKKQYKVDQVPEFALELYIDQFLYANRKNVIKVNDELTSIDNSIKRIDSEIDKLHDKNKHIRRSFSGNIGEDNSTPIDVKSFFTEMGDDNKGEDEINDLVYQKDKLKQTKKSLLKNAKTKQYNLHSIIIHDGDHNQGHYFVYVRIDNRWFYFNDKFVREVDDKTVSDDCYGKKYANRTAYCFIYVTNEIKDVAVNKIKISKELEQYVNTKNKELKEYLIDKPIDNLIKTVKENLKTLEKEKKNKGLDKVIPRIQSFELYLYDRFHLANKNIKDFRDILHGYLVDKELRKIPLKENKKPELRMENLPYYPDIWSKLEIQSDKLKFDLPEPNNMNKLIETEKDRYIDSIKAIRLIGTSIQFILSNNLVEYIETISLFLNIQPFGKNSLVSVHYTIFKDNILYLILNAIYIVKELKTDFNRKLFNSIMKVALYTIIINNEEYGDPTHLTENHIVDLLNELEELCGQDNLYDVFFYGIILKKMIESKTEPVIKQIQCFSNITVK